MRRADIAFFVLALSACSLPRSTIGHAGGMDAGVEGIDAAGVDAAVVDPDAWVAPGTDGGPPVDAFRAPDAFVAIDTGPTCTPRCEADTAVTCPGGIESRTVCGAGLCSTTGSVHCLACTPSTTGCSADGASATTCDSTGAMLSMTHCDRGCLANACRAAQSCSFTTDGMIAPPTTMSFDLCGNGADNTPSSSGPCSGFGASGEDVLLRLEIDRRQHVVIKLNDGDPSTPVDPLVYVRTVCDQRNTELACSDDISSTNRNSSLTLDLDAGEYFLVLDIAAGSCGTVDLAVMGTPF